MIVVPMSAKDELYRRSGVYAHGFQIYQRGGSSRFRVNTRVDYKPLIKARVNEYAFAKSRTEDVDLNFVFRGGRQIRYSVPIQVRVKLSRFLFCFFELSP